MTKFKYDGWDNLAKVVYKRTYSRNDNDIPEDWNNTVERVIKGNIKGFNVSEEEVERLRYFMLNRKAMPAGRGLWYSGSPSHEKLGANALCNCWAISSDDWRNFVIGQDLLMLGGGVSITIEEKFSAKLPKVKSGVGVLHKLTKDADFIVPDSREGWCKLIYKTLEAFFETGKSFTYSTICIRGYGEKIVGFGGTASGPSYLIKCVEKISSILQGREGKHVRPIDAMDIFCSIGEMVVSGNLRRSAILIQGDSWDREYLKAKRWDLQTVPSQRAMANLSVVCDDVEDLHPLFWKTYEHGEPFGIINRKNIQTYGRMGEKKKDTAVTVNPCVVAGTEILTKDGYFPIESRVGLKTEIWNGFEWSLVVPQITGYNQPIVRVILSDGRELVCTEAHRFAIADRYSGRYKMVAAKDLSTNMKLIKSEFPVLHTGQKINEKIAYTQGFYSGDGMDGYGYFWVYGNKRFCMRYMSGLAHSYNLKYKRCKFDMDFTPQKKEFVPYEWNLEAKLDWLAGLLDSDGAELKEGGAQITSVDRAFIINVQKMLTTMGTPSRVVPATPAGNRLLPDGHGGKKEFYCKDSYRILVNAKQIQFLKKLGLNCHRLKFEKNPNRDASRFVRVLRVEPAGRANRVYCFTEPKRHLGIFNGILTGQCGEACLEVGGYGVAESCNLQNIFLPNLKNKEEFIEAAVLMHRYGKRVTGGNYLYETIDEVVKRNRRIGTSITGCLQSNLFTPEILDEVYAAIQDENVKYSKKLGIPESIRTTTVNPAGTLGILGQTTSGIHPAYSRFYIRRVRFGSNDLLIPKLREAGHKVEPEKRLDGSINPNTLVVDFYCEASPNTPTVEGGFDTWKQLEVIRIAQEHWSDQSVSCTVYYKKDEIPKIKEWLRDNLSKLKTMSFLCYSDHGFAQAPLEAITEEQYKSLTKDIRDADIQTVNGGQIDIMECAAGICPIK